MSSGWEALGLDVAELLGEVGIEPHQLLDADRVIDLRTVRLTPVKGSR